MLIKVWKPTQYKIIKKFSTKVIDNIKKVYYTENSKFNKYLTKNKWGRGCDF